MFLPLLRRGLLPCLTALLLASCGDPTVSYWKKVADINEEYSEKSDELAARLMKLKKHPSLPGLAEASEQAAAILQERDEELADLDTENVDAAVTAYVADDRKLFARGQKLAEEYRQYFAQCLKGGPDPSQVAARIGRGSRQINRIVSEAHALETRAQALRKEHSAAHEKELPPLHFRLPDVKPLLSPR